MRLVVVEGIDPTDVARAVPVARYRAGATLAADRAVLHTEWRDKANELDAVVRDGPRYVLTLRFGADGRRGLRFGRSTCTCRTGTGCSHAVAAALTVAAPVSPPTPDWAHSLGALFEPTGSEPAAGAVRSVLAIEVGLTQPVPTRPGSPPARPGLSARLVRPGRNGWVGGGLSWGKLESTWQLSDCRPDHVRLAREFYALYRAQNQPGRHHHHADEKVIDLAEFDSHRLWPLLDEAAAAGLPLVHTRKHLGPLTPHARGELCLDVTAGEVPATLVITPRLLLDGSDEEAVPVCFIGRDGHGVAYLHGAREPGLDAAGQRPLRLVRLASPVPAPLQGMALRGERLPVPAGEQGRLRAEFYPRLRRLAPVVSSDGAFEPPVISDPTLVLRATYSDDHDLGLEWEWAYTVGDEQVRSPLGPSDVDDHRDPARERAVLDTLHSGLFDHARLRGLDTMHFTTEVLPVLRDTPGVLVEVAGTPATYRDAGDTMRIGLSTDDIPDDTDWFDLGVSISVDGREIPFTEVFTALATGEPDLLLADGAYFSLHKPELQALRGLIDEAKALQDTPGPLRISRFQADLWNELTRIGVIDRQAKAWQEQVTGLLGVDALEAPALPTGLVAELRPYQRDGFAWLEFLWRFGLGGVLADDMGLGKTVQTLALLCHARETAPAADPFLIIAPTSVVPNWPAEAARFAPGLRVVTITDTLARNGRELPAVLAGADVVVTSYTLFRLDFPAYGAAGWSGLVLDEAQFTKNHQSKVHQCARLLPAPFKLAITGTPMENNLMELWSLLSITAPGLFPHPTRFREHFARPIERQGDAELLATLRRRIRPLVKRRTKEQVVPELPAKQEQVLDIELDPRHRRIYQRHLQRERQKILGLIDDVTRNRFTILRSITLLRRLSLHPGLIDDAHAQLGSAKIDAILEQLSTVVAGGHRALVFSQFTGFLGLVRERLDAAGISYCYLDGTTRNRKAVVERFKDGGDPVFLISLKAGGFGLNLTEADYCFLLDPWWNPATEAQAIDRTHRIGQARNVHVYRLIATDTIEEKVLALATRKAELFTGVMDEGDAFGTDLDADDIRALLS